MGGLLVCGFNVPMDKGLKIGIVDVFFCCVTYNMVVDAVRCMRVSRKINE